MNELLDDNSGPAPGTAERFLLDAPQFRLGALVTEQAHPDTADLSRMAREDVLAAVESLRQVDLKALRQLEEYAVALQPLAQEMAKVLEGGGRIFLCGCGATGRLSIALEIFARQGLLGEATGERVIGFMAGGDAALVRSIERFEDYPEYGARQLRELGFAAGDLMVGITEGGETPFVIGAVEEALNHSAVRPFFLYCNPDVILSEVVERSRRVLGNEAIRKINLTVGPMAITGSTRMQASTVQMAGAGWALACRHAPERIGERARAFREWVEESDWSFLAEFIEAESAIYAEGARVLYEPGAYGITVLTDTTERSPTFSLPPFENVLSPDELPAWCYVHVDASSPAGAWRSLLDRFPRTLAWGGLEHLTGEASLMGFDFSDTVVDRRARLGRQVRFGLRDTPEAIEFTLGGRTHRVPAAGRDLFSRHLLLKLLLNAHSTLVMGRQGRFDGNVMTHLFATNNKLIDRAARYVQMLLRSRFEREAEYETVVRALFDVRARLSTDEPIVLRTLEALTGDGEN